MYETIETHAHAFLTLNIFSIGTVFYVLWTVHEDGWIRVSILSIFITRIKLDLDHKMYKSYFSWFQLETS